MITPFIAGAAALALLPLSATAQDHSGHDPHAGHAMPAAEPKTADPVDHSAMDHSSPSTPAEGSGTARLPANEGGHTGPHIDAGDDWMVMTRGFA